MKLLEYIKARLMEHGSWISIGGGVAAAAALSSPWSYVFVAVAVVGVLVPNGQAGD